MCRPQSAVLPLDQTLSRVVFLPLVPAAVSDLLLENNGSLDSLRASWVTAMGSVDAYLVSLATLGSADQDRTLPPNATEVVFSGLTPGRPYQVTVKSKAGEQTTEAVATGRTGKSFWSVNQLAFSHD